ncbi:MAG: hypothetical protein HYZ52_06905 [Candidatus Omnitrophica bacterium]|nr:hypothetical protein [Candidatus Omnitrophota bacterium]
MPRSTRFTEVVKRLGDLFIESTLGALKAYQEKTLDLAKLRAATIYIRAVKALREQCVAICILLVCLMVIGFSLVFVPLAFIVMLPLGSGLKALAVLGWGLFCLAVAAGVSSRYLSEKKWLELSGSRGLLDKIVDKT